MPKPTPDIKVGDHVALKKTHPCGSNDWEIIRVGADIGIVCSGCERRVMLTRAEFNRRFVKLISN